ncbi:ceramidase domain-containing protein [Shimia thalassica]|uniref:ceramidase domain-containing protein n=1 Tax=Shimia thalassica TaxID=1715693 RepID=UPI001C0A1677|nr:ceramidase domain-containing protein [Shimia thalassica]MBU2942521.1 ceramidase [Shimia thalassica]MDO6504452.1 ceramidase domain-containing protein [Shimia thalassica]
MDYATYIDLYCERTAPGFWNEPINAISNIAFPLAALWAWIEARKNPPVPLAIHVLIVLAALIGVGSFLFHTFANSWTELADVIPIWSFVALYVLVSIHLIGGVAPRRILRIAAIVGAVLVVWFLASGSPEADASHAHGHSHSPFNGSLQYAPALIALVVFSIITWRRHHPMAPWAIAATLVFGASLTFRTVDISYCSALPLGTHFMWHLLNGLMVGLLLQALVRNRL